MWQAPVTQQVWHNPSFWSNKLPCLSWDICTTDKKCRPSSPCSLAHCFQHWASGGSVRSSTTCLAPLTAFSDVSTLTVVFRWTFAHLATWREGRHPLTCISLFCRRDGCMCSHLLACRTVWPSLQPGSQYLLQQYRLRRGTRVSSPRIDSK